MCPANGVKFCNQIIQSIHDGKINSQFILFQMSVSLKMGGKFIEQQILQYTLSEISTQSSTI
jgi:hypothetical protein